MATYEIALLAIIVAFIVGYAIGWAPLRLNVGVLVITTALLILIAAAIATVWWQADFAEQFAIIAYYFLITGVILNIINLIREGSTKR